MNVRTHIRTCAILGCCLLGLVALPACGAGDGVSNLDLNLTFSPRDVPSGTVRINYFVLPAILSDNVTEVDCLVFFRADDRKSIFEYSDEWLLADSEDVVPADPTEVVLRALPEGKLIFYVEAEDNNSEVLACGCGSGHIIKGKKTAIPISMVQDCG